MRARSPTLTPPPDVVPGDGGGGGWAWLLTASGAIEAELVRGVLESAGIVPVALDGRDTSPGAWMFLSGNVNAPVRVFVPKSMLDSARLTLLEAGFDAPARAEPPSARPRRRGVRRRILSLVAVITIAFFVWATLNGVATCALHISC